MLYFDHQSIFFFQYLGTKEDSSRIINMEKSAEVFNEVPRLHMQETPDCNRLVAWDMATEGTPCLGTRLAMQCRVCRYVSKRCNLWKEVSTQSGRNAAIITCNYGIPVGLGQTCTFILCTQG